MIRTQRFLAVCTALILVSAMAPPPPAAGAVPGVRIAVATPMASVNVLELAATERAAGFHQPTRSTIAAMPTALGPHSTIAAAGPPTMAAPLPRIVGSLSAFSEGATFAGMADSAGPGSPGPVVEPPDPWVAVGPNHVVQAVNTRLRFSSRQGSNLGEVSLAAFFSEPGTQVMDSDPRVLYDAAKDRWLASELSADCSTGHLRLAVSDTGDPTLGWHNWDFAFPGAIPDYPGLGFSSDKVALSANVFSWSGCSGGAFQSGDVAAFDWSDILDGGGLSGTQFTYPLLSTWRPAANLTANPVIHMVAEGPSGEVVYGAVSGTNLGANLVVSASDLTTGGPVSGFAIPPQPQDPLGTLGPGAVDGRPTDALWQNGHLWFVSTYPWTFDGGSTYHDTVRVTELATTGTPTLDQDFLIGSPGLDNYMGGIGLSQAGALYVVYSESGSSAYVSLRAAFQSAADPPGSVTGDRLLASGLAGYKGDRWGDYVGVATDPANPYAVWQAGEYANSVGSWSTRVSMLSEDGAAPSVTSRSPLANATNVGLSPTITAQLSEPVTGVSTTSMAISNVSNFVNLAATVSYDSASRTATLHPSAPLVLGATYRVAMSGRITDLAGNPLAWTTWNFSTAAPVTFKLGSHTGYKFSASGAVTAIKTFTLAGNSAASATKRQAIANQSGTWLSISSGVWAGYWIRESSVVYLTAMPISHPPGANASFSPAVPLSFKLGTHTGYKFSGAGALTAEKTFTLAGNSTALTTARSTNSAQAGKWFLVGSGVWAGFWVRSSDVIYLSP